MADPNPYVPGYSYSGWQANNPTKPLPAPQVDNDFANIAQSTEELVDAIKDVRRSDGALQNGIVTTESLADDVKALIGSVDYIDVVGANIAAVETVATNISDVTTTASISMDVTTVAMAAPSVEAVAAIAADVSATAGVAADVSTVAAIDGDVSTVAGIAADVTTNAGIAADISVVAEMAEDIPPLATRVLPTGGVVGQIPIKQSSDEGDSAWGNPPGGGDMLASVYDPNGVEGDAFDSANHAYDNAASGLVAEDVQAAVDELAAGKLDVDAGNVGGAAAQTTFRRAIGADILPGFSVGSLAETNVSDANHDLDIGAGVHASMAADPVRIVVPALTKRLDATFAEGDGNGAMVAGESLPTSGWVNIWAICKADGSDGDYCANNHASSGLNPALPDGYTHKRLIESRPTDGSANLISILNLGDERWYADGLGVLDAPASTADQGTTAQSITLSVPRGRAMLAVVNQHISVADTGASVNLSPLAIADQAPALAAAPLATFRISTGSGSSVSGGAQTRVWTNTSAQVRRDANATVTYRLNTMAWVEDRGRSTGFFT